MAVDWTIKPYDLSQTVGAFSQGFLTPFVASNQMRESQMKQQQMEEAKRKQTALNQYQQTGDPNVLRGVDPMMAERVKSYIAERPPEELAKLAHITNFIDLARPYVNSQNWPLFRERAIKLGAPENMVPPADANPDQLNQFFNASRMFDAHLKAIAHGPKVIPGHGYVDSEGFHPLEPSELDKAKTEKERAAAGEHGAKAEWYKDRPRVSGQQQMYKDFKEAYTNKHPDADETEVLEAFESARAKGKGKGTGGDRCGNR